MNYSLFTEWGYSDKDKTCFHSVFFLKGSHELKKFIKKNKTSYHTTFDSCEKAEALTVRQQEFLALKNDKSSQGLWHIVTNKENHAKSDQSTRIQMLLSRTY